MPLTAYQPGRRETPRRTPLLKRVVLAAAALLAIPTVSFLTASPAAAASVCKSSGAVPNGHVIVGELSESSCSGSFPNAWDVRQPSDTSPTVICRVVSPMPSGFVILSETIGSTCPGTFPNAWIITRPSTSTSTLVCADSPVPSGWVVVSQSDSGSCPGRFPNAKTIVPTNPTTTPPAGDSTVVIRGVGSDRCVDVPNGDAAYGTQVQLWDCNGTASQSWLYSGTYKSLYVLRRACLEASGTTAGSPVTLQGCYARTRTHQRWDFNGDGSITDRRSGLCLDATNGDTTNGTKIQMWPCNGTVAQKWIRG